MIHSLKRFAASKLCAITLSYHVAIKGSQIGLLKVKTALACPMTKVSMAVSVDICSGLGI